MIDLRLSELRKLWLKVAALAFVLMLVILIVVLQLKTNKDLTPLKPRGIETKNIKFTQCPHTNTKVGNLKIKNCVADGQVLCQLSDRKHIEFETNFIAVKKFKRAYVELRWMASSIKQDACSSGLTCPSKAGQLQHLDWSADFMTKLETGRGPMRLLVTDGTPWIEDIQLCLDFSAEIT